MPVSPTITAPRRGLVRSGLIAAVLAAAGMLLGSPATSSAAACDTSWAAPISGNFDAPGMWTNGRPTIATTACLPDLGTPYTVTVRDGGNAASSLTIAANVKVVLEDGPGGASLHTATGVDNSGELDLAPLHAVTYQLTNDAGTLLNEQNAIVKIGGPLDVTGGIDNRSLLVLDSEAGFDIDVTTSPGELVNTGTVVADTAASIDALANDGSVELQGRDTTLQLGRVDGLAGGTLSGGAWDVEGGAVLQLPGTVTTLDSALTLTGGGSVVDSTGADALHFLGHVGTSGALVLHNTDLAPGHGPALTNAGEISVDGCTLTVTGDYLQTDASGRLALQHGAALVTTPSRQVRLDAGGLEVSGQAQIDGNVTAGSTIIGVQPQSFGDALAIHGSLTLSSASQVQLVVTPTLGMGRIATDGSVTEAGTLMTVPIGDVFPGAGSSYPALTYPAASGGFSQLDIGGFAPVAGPTSLSLVAQVKIRVDDPAVAYGGWFEVPDDAADGGAYHQTSRAGDTASISFGGTTLGLSGPSGPDGGRATVTIDGQAAGRIEQYAPSPGRWTFSVTGLPPGEHTFTLKTLRRHAPASSGTVVRIDTLSEDGVPAFDTDPVLTYDGWAGGGRQDNALRYSYRSKRTAVYSFSGDGQVQWITNDGPDHGRVRVLVDGVKMGVFDLYSPDYHTSVVKTFGGLGPGPHTITIVALGSKNAASSGTIVAIEGFVRPA